MFYITGYHPSLQKVQIYDSRDNTVEWVSVADLTLHFSRLRQDFESIIYNEDYSGNTWGNAMHQRLVPFEIYDLHKLDEPPVLRVVLNSIGITCDEEYHGERYADVVSLYNQEQRAFGDFSFLGTLYHDFDNVYTLLPILTLLDNVTDFAKFVDTMSLETLKFVLLYYRERVKLLNKERLDELWGKMLFSMKSCIKGIKNGNYVIAYNSVEEARYFYCLNRYFKTEGVAYVCDVEAVYPDDLVFFWNFIDGAKVTGCIGKLIFWEPGVLKSMGDLAKYKMAYY